MFRLRPVTTNAALFSTAGTWGETQIVATPTHVVLEIQTRNYDTHGVLRRDHAFARIPLASAMHVRDLLDQAIGVSLRCSGTGQSGLWSDSAIRSVAAEVSRGARPA